MPPKPPLTHFLCLPLHTQSSHGPLSKSLATFLSETTHARTPENPDGIPEGAVRPVGTVCDIHLYFAILVLNFSRAFMQTLPIALPSFNNVMSLYFLQRKEEKDPIVRLSHHGFLLYFEITSLFVATSSRRSLNSQDFRRLSNIILSKCIFHYYNFGCSVFNVPPSISELQEQVSTEYKTPLEVNILFTQTATLDSRRHVPNNTRTR